ncbi:MAG TPA: HtaA domain-containing protein [Caulobacteraceae bacterium]|nr:HtaA domain-containing protein [Caulobacteraceae bacterium]
MTEAATGAPALTWGVKQSFRDYVEGAGGVIELGGGATRTPDGAFTFAAAPGGSLRRDASGRLNGRGEFQGDVRFEAHGGMLSVILADPRLQVGAEAATITVADSRERDNRVELAVLDLAAATPGEHGEVVIPAKLSKDGWRILGDHYLPFTPLDPVRLTLG